MAILRASPGCVSLPYAYDMRHVMHTKATTLLLGANKGRAEFKKP